MLQLESIDPRIRATNTLVIILIIAYYGNCFISYVSRDRRILVEFVHSTSRNLERRQDEHASAVTYYHT